MLERRKHLIFVMLLAGGCAGLRGAPLDEAYGPAEPRDRLTPQPASPG